METRRRVQQSIHAVLVGWLLGALCFLMYMPWAFVYMAGFVVPAWLLFVVPHYLFLPRTSFLWNRWVCPLYGALWGIAILRLYVMVGYRGIPPVKNLSDIWNPWCLVAAGVTGFVTCIVASQQEESA